MERQPVILSLCDYTGEWSKPYETVAKVIRVDLKRGQDVRLLEWPGRVDGVLAAPPCTHLAGSGARWWKAKGEEALLDALAIADACLRQVALGNLRWWCLENPVGRLSRYYGPPRMTFHPYEYAGWADDPQSEAYTKRTCLWGNFVEPERRPVDPTLGSYMHLLPPSDDRAALRSVTPQGFSRAFASANWVFSRIPVPSQN